MKMQEQPNTLPCYEEDEIDLRELFRTLLRYKRFIILFTFAVTLFAGVYGYMKYKTPRYSVHAIVEIGRAIDQGLEKPTYIDNPNSIKPIVENLFAVSVKIPKRAPNIIELSATSTDKEAMKRTISNAVEYIIQRDERKAKLFERYEKTRQVGEVTVAQLPSKTKLIVAVAFVTGLMLSVFLVFFIEFIKGLKEDEKQ